MTNEKNVSVFPDFADADIKALASMCTKCRKVTKRNFLKIKTHYYYFVPQDKQQLPVANNIFQRYGINMEIHKSEINGKNFPLDVLRIKTSRVPSGAERLFALIERQRTIHFYSGVMEDSKIR